MAVRRGNKQKKPPESELYSRAAGIIMVELWGIEPQASALRTQRSTN